MSLTTSAFRIRRVPNLAIRAVMYSSKDSGEAGSIRSAGGAFATKEKAQEDQYFRKLQQDQLKEIKSHLHDEMSHHEDEIKHHKQQIEKLQQKANKLSK